MKRLVLCAPGLKAKYTEWHSESFMPGFPVPFRKQEVREFLQKSKEFKEIPPTVHCREQIWSEALSLMKEVCRRRPLGRRELMAAGRRLLKNLDLEEQHLGYAMVIISNVFWLEQFMSVSIEQRLLLLPRCLTSLRDVYVRAEELGYKIHVAEGSPIVVKIIASEEMNAIFGIGCLDSLEKALDKVQQVGIPAVAIPLTTTGCHETEVDMHFVSWLLESNGTGVVEHTRTYLPFLRVTYRMFNTAELELLLGGIPDREDETVRIALEWLQQGGKRLRAFTTLASFGAFAPDEDIPLGVKRIALAIEAFHKASLIHDDIEDDEEMRYGEETIHSKYGVPVAINVGDYLVGLGYRLAATIADEYGAETALQLSRVFSDAHVKLVQGQGTELFWRRSPSSDLSLADVLHSYMLKTSPAFEAGISSAMVIAGVHKKYGEIARLFSRHIGVAFQIQNDLKGWALDALQVHPNALLALALETCTEAEKTALLHPNELGEVEEIYAQGKVFDRARQLVERLRQHAAEVADNAPEKLGEMLHLLVETILYPKQKPFHRHDHEGVCKTVIESSSRFVYIVHRPDRSNRTS